MKKNFQPFISLLSPDDYSYLLINYKITPIMKVASVIIMPHIVKNYNYLKIRSTVPILYIIKHISIVINTEQINLIIFGINWRHFEFPFI
jgi:hypothetical protein